MTQKMKTLVEFIVKKHIKKTYKYTPKDKAELSQVIKKELDGGNYDLNCINLSSITDISDLFSPYIFVDVPGVVQLKLDQKAQQNLDISKWNTSNVTDMNGLFNGCKWINCDVTQWDTSNVEDMSYMFKECSSFNQDISGWDVSKVKDMTKMFWHARSFTCDLNNWNVKLTDSTEMSKMFLDSGLYEKEPSWYKG